MKEIINLAKRWRFRITSLPKWLQEEMIKCWWVLGLYPKRMLGGGWYLLVPPEQNPRGHDKEWEMVFICSLQRKIIS